MRGKRRDRENQAVEAPGGISVKEAGRRGGCATLERRGRAFFQKIGAKGGRKTADLYRDLLSEFGRKGGRPRRPGLDENLGEECSEKKGGEIWL